MSENRDLQIDRDCAYIEMDSIIKFLIMNVGIIISTFLLFHYFFDFGCIYIIISFFIYILFNIKNFKRIYDLNKDISDIESKIKKHENILKESKNG